MVRNAVTIMISFASQIVKVMSSRSKLGLALEFAHVT